MPGGQKRLTQGKLCLLPIDPGLKQRFIRGAEEVWRTLEASDTCSHIAKRMLELMRENPIQVRASGPDTPSPWPVAHRRLVLAPAGLWYPHRVCERRLLGKPPRRVTRRPAGPLLPV